MDVPMRWKAYVRSEIYSRGSLSSASQSGTLDPQAARRKEEQFQTGRNTQRFAERILQCRQKLSMVQTPPGCVAAIAHEVGNVISS